MEAMTVGEFLAYLSAKLPHMGKIGVATHEQMMAEEIDRMASALTEEDPRYSFQDAALILELQRLYRK